MNTAVEDHSGLCMSAFMALAIQLSPLRIEARLCWLVPPCGPSGNRIENDGSRFSRTSLRKLDVCTTRKRCGPYRHSAKLGQIDHTYAVVELPARVLAVESVEDRR